VSSPFDPRRGLIVIGAELNGPSGAAVLRLAVDTGATSTLVSVAMLVAIGYDPALAARLPPEVESSLRLASNCIG
jgi:hypothetical protein